MIDWRCDNGVMESLCAVLVIQLDQSGVGCNGPSLTHYVACMFTNTLAPLPFVFSSGISTAWINMVHVCITLL